ncbi:hypothetical protein SAMN00808754_1932 [Thermanaeromonas toyohensis ToBE]|uniref:Uncharacterized protein n=1 Tax=Thermanaeromonas toyohensis ToBE TaxID=698762 RepID=A0A1W1VXA9_9FIRM|nr:hypothetical protein [Thermanaeromonas toyohensis]SMB97741.1 hypothetical protein SAMN00808754_1932 [Thermanaeromonas toyohensis ToBE]
MKMTEKQLMKFFEMLDKEALLLHLQDTREKAKDYYTHLLSQGMSSEAAMLETISMACYQTLKIATFLALAFTSYEAYDPETIGKEIETLLKSLH